MTLNEEQQEQIRKQLAAHQHPRYTTDILFAGTPILQNFIVEPGTLRPEKMTSLWLARWLFITMGYIKGKLSSI